MNTSRKKAFWHWLVAVCLFTFLWELTYAQPLSTISFDTDEGSWMSLDVSPNGEQIAFELLGDIYQLPISGGVAKAIISGKGFASQPRYSPDGKQLVFVSDRSGEDNLWLASTDGSNLIQLSKRRDGDLVSPVWSRDGQTIYVSQITSRRSMNAKVEIWSYPTNGSKPEKIDTPNMGQGSLLVSSFSPGAYGAQPSADGSDIFFTAAAPRQHNTTSGPKAEIIKTNLKSGHAELVSYRSRAAFKPQLSSDGKWLAYGAVHSGKTGLRLRDLETGKEHWLLQDIGFNALESRASRDFLPSFAFTPSGDALVIAYSGKINRVALKDGQVTNIPFKAKVQMTIESKVAPTTTIDQGPVTAKLVKDAVISPDGTQFVFSAFGRLYRMAITDQIPHKLTNGTDFGEFHPAWSPDGSWLTFVSWHAQEGGAIWKVPADGSLPAKQLSTDDGYYRNPTWSPDGKMIWAVRTPKVVRLENAHVPMGKAEHIVKIPSDGGQTLFVTPAEGALRVHFTENSQRFYAYSPRSGLSSWNLDGNDKKTHLTVMGLASDASSPVPASDILLSADEQHALASVSNQIYLIDMPTEQTAINVYSSSDAYNKVTLLGADQFSWENSETFVWSAGSSLYRKSINSNTTEEIDVTVQQPRKTPNGLLALRGARIITMNGDKIIPNGDILIDGNRIQAVGKRGTVKIPKTATVIDMRGKTIMPGIVDIHAHWSTKRSVLDLEDYNAYANLAYGVTAIRDPQSDTADIFGYSDAVATGEMVSPRIFSTGPGVFFFNNFQSYEQVYAVLERYKNKYRTHLIKSYLPGSRQVRQWIVRACRELGLVVTSEGGSDAKMDLTFALDGFSGTEHAIPIIPLYKDIIQLYAQAGISYTPTLLVSFGGPFAVNYFIANQLGLKDDKLHRFIPSDLISQRTEKTFWVDPERHIFPLVAKGAKEILEAGGNVGLGGHGEMQGLQVHWEMWSFAAGGMKNLDVLRVATLESAKAIGLDREIGSIESGKFADLVVMDQNPLEDIHNTNSISRVMVNGTLYDANTLDQQWPEKKSLPTPWWQNRKVH